MKTTMQKQLKWAVSSHSRCNNVLNPSIQYVVRVSDAMTIGQRECEHFVNEEIKWNKN